MSCLNNMKNLFFTLLSVLSFSLLGQNTPTPRHYKTDLLLRNYRIQSSERTVLQPGFTFGRGLHNLRIAPNFQLYSSEARNEPYGFAFTGVSVAYQLRVPSALDFLDQHFELETTTQFFGTEWTANTYIPAIDSYQNVHFKTTEYFQSLTLGYGFIIKTGEHFYITQTTAAGIYYSRLWGGPVDESLQVDDEIDFRGYDGFEAMIVISAGVGWDF